MALITAAIKRVLPDPVVKAIRTYRGRSKLKAFAGLTNQEVFTKIYEEGSWGAAHDPGQTFFSGSGSHAGTVVETYVDAVGRFLRSWTTSRTSWISAAATSM